MFCFSITSKAWRSGFSGRDETTQAGNSVWVTSNWVRTFASLKPIGSYMILLVNILFDIILIVCNCLLSSIGQSKFFISVLFQNCHTPITSQRGLMMSFVVVSYIQAWTWLFPFQTILFKTPCDLFMSLSYW